MSNRRCINYPLLLLSFLAGPVQAQTIYVTTSSTTVLAGTQVPFTVKMSPASSAFASFCPSFQLDYGDGTTKTYNFFYQGEEASFHPIHSYQRVGTYPVRFALPQNSECPATLHPTAHNLQIQVVSQNKAAEIAPALEITSPDAGPSYSLNGLMVTANMIEENKKAGVSFDGIQYGPGIVNQGTNIAKIRVLGPLGAGCDAHVNWGDGSPPQALAGSFPLVSEHHYTAGGNFQIRVKAEAKSGAVNNMKCSGEATGIYYAYPPSPKLTAIVGSPAPVALNQWIDMAIQGEGICGLTKIQDGPSTGWLGAGVRFHPNNQFSLKFKKKFNTPGVHQLTVSSPSCGPVSTQITVLPPPGTTPAIPATNSGVAASQSGGPVPGSPSKPPCKVPNKPGVGKDCLFD